MSARKIVLLAVAGPAVGLVSLVALGFVVKALALDDILSNAYVPTAEKIVAGIHLRPFLVNASEIEGIYGNRDVDSVIFQYRTGERDLEAFSRRSKTTGRGRNGLRCRRTEHSIAFNASSRKGAGCSVRLRRSV